VADQPSARDRKALIALIQTAQLVDAFGHLPKKQFMDRLGDQARVAARVFEMRKRAGDLSASFRKAHADVPWDDLEALGRTPDDLWRAAKKIAPAMLAELQPLVADQPEAAFSIAEEPKRRAKRR
jgi:hypothetical protein